MALVTVLFCSTVTFAQGKKTIRKLNIESVTAVDHENGRVLNNRKKVFHKSGEVAEDYDYDKHGELVRVQKYKFDDNDEVIEEVENYPQARETTRTICKYNGLGEKTEEHVYNGTGTPIKIHRYKYNAQGLKTERTTTDASGNVISVRKYTYTFRR